MDGRTKYRFQLIKRTFHDAIVFSTLQQKQRKHCRNRCLQYRPRDGIMAKQNNNELQPIAFTSRDLNDFEKKISVSELELLAIVWGLECFRFHLYSK